MDLWWQLHAVFGTVLNVHEINGLGEWTMVDNIDCQVGKMLIKIWLQENLNSHGCAIRTTISVNI
jgi:hypothetical protein